MSIVEYVFTAIGFIVIAGGFVYGIYETYFQKEHTDTTISSDDLPTQ